MREKNLSLEQLEKPNVRLKEQREENRVLRDRLDLLDSCLNILFDGVTVLNTEGEIVYVNRIKAERIGYTQEELIGIKPIQIIAEKDLKRYVDEFEKVLYKGEIPRFFEYTVKHKNGREIPMEISFSILHNAAGKVIGAVGASRDITHERSITQKLIESEEKYRFIFEATGTAMLTTSEDGIIRMVNKDFERLFGCSKDEVIGKKKLSDFMKDTLPPATELSPSYPKRYECVFIDKSGKKINLIVIENILPKNPASTEYEKVIALIDVTENKKVMREMEKYQRQLRNLSVHLQNVIEEDRKKLAHEIHDSLGQELTALKIQLSLLVENPPSSKKTLKHRINSMVNLVDDIMTEVRDTSLSLSPIVLEHFGFESAIRWLIEDFQKNTNIQYDLRYDLKYTLPNNQFSLMVFRIFQELMTNTARHSEATQVNIVFKEIDNSLYLEFRDNGKGIPKSKIFSLNSFGLLGIRERALSQGGSVKITSKSNKETKVIIKIPLPRDIQND